ncbi:MAG: DUF6516 family protein [Gammaproteobacteria bacterium]|nr:DUF6516 family protein [Gammaproteobacteria bacterium]
MGRDTGLDTLLELDGYIIEQGNGFWVKIEARLQKSPTKEKPHGISYSLTLHDPYGQRILGYDNAHAVPDKRKSKFSARRIEYDHKHESLKDKGSPYEFADAYQLLKDFFEDVDKVLKQHIKR